MSAAILAGGLSSAAPERFENWQQITLSARGASQWSEEGDLEELIDMKKKGGKSTIVKDLMDKGFTARKAEQAVNAVIRYMKLGLWWGEPVEVPGGTIQAQVRKGTPRRQFQKFRNIQTENQDHRFVAYPGRRRVVKFTPDSNLDLTPMPRPRLPETPEEVEARQLASELLGKPADRAIIARLQQAVEVHPFKQGALLRRLREFKSRGWRFDCVTSLAHEVASYYWL